MAINRVLPVLACVALLLPHSAISQTATAKKAPATQVLRPTQANKKQFDRELKTLPDSTIVESGSQRLTVGEIKAKSADLHRASVADLQAGAKASTEGIAARQSRFEQQKMARLEADNAKGKGELSKLSRLEAIRAEAARMMERTKTATPAEMAEMNQRARQLLMELNTVARTKG